MINKEPMRQESNTVEMMFQNTTRTIKVYEVELTGLNGDLKVNVEMNGVERKVLLSIPNSHYSEVIAANSYLQGESEGKEHYIPHKPVIKETAETAKLRIVYDASAKANHKSPSLNECLEIGPPLQRKILDILLRTIFKPVLLAGDMKQAF